jgi:hypothetical protein
MVAPVDSPNVQFDDGAAALGVELWPHPIAVIKSSAHATTRPYISTSPQHTRVQFACHATTLVLREAASSDTIHARRRSSTAAKPFTTKP